MDRAAVEHQRDEGFRALGRFVAQFSQLVFQMRIHVEAAIGSRDEDAIDRLLDKVGLEDLRQIFFNVCREKSWPLSTDEERIIDRLDSMVRREIKRRHKFVHGIWHISLTPMEPRFGTLGRKKAKSVTEIDGFSDRLGVLVPQIDELGHICCRTWYPELVGGEDMATWQSNTRVRDIFTLDGDDVRRMGALAHTVRWGRGDQSGPSS